MAQRRISHQGRVRRRSRYALVAVLCLMLLVTAGLATWWWTVVMRTDPIAAEPVQAQAVVVSSPACADDDNTSVIRYAGVIPGGSAELRGCGFTPGQHVVVEYLAGSPKMARLAGTTTAGTPNRGRMLLPIGIAASGLAALTAAGMLIVDRRRKGSVSVADLQRRIAVARAGNRPAERVPPGEPGAGASSIHDAAAAPEADTRPPGTAPEADTRPPGTATDIDSSPWARPGILGPDER